MKKIIFTIITLGIAMLGYSQSVITETADGKVGIGTTAPVSRLDITSGEYKTYFTGNALTFKNNNVTSYIDKKDSGSLRFRMGANYNTAMTIGNNLNVGIGITNPVRKLEIYADEPVLRLRSKRDGTTSYAFLEFNDVNSRMGYIGFGSSGTNHMYIHNDTGGDIVIPNGKVGIGTTAPVSRLDITVGEYKTYFTGNALTFKNNNVTSYIDKKDSGALRFRMGTNYNTAMTIGNNLNVGIGITNPARKLEIYADEPVLRLRSKRDGIASYAFLEFNDVNSRMGYIGFGSSGTNHMYLYNQNGGDVIIPKGNVGIGTTNTFGYKLAVNGNIGAKEVKVETNSAWPDFVFKKEYKLPTLTEVENHIKKKGHLQNIPSAAEVKKDGFFLGEMDAKLLQKIEELTLYTIQQEKDNKKLLSIIEKLEARIAKIENINK